MASHYGRDSTYNKISAQFFWYSIYNDVVDFVKKCMACQKQGNLTLKTKTEHSIAVPTSDGLQRNHFKRKSNNSFTVFI